MHKDFDVREIDPEIIKNYDYVAKPFSHSFYCITLFLEGDIKLSAGFWKRRITKPAVYFKTPSQVVSWMKPARLLREYFIVFNENFMQKNKALEDIVFDLPFFQFEKAIPFEIEPDEVELLTVLYKQIMKEYRSDNSDKLELIASYTYTLLIQIRRLYFKYSDTDQKLTTHIRDREHILVEDFSTLVRQHIVTHNKENHNRSIKYFASKLSTHPNHLNAVVKRQRQKTAIHFVHEQILKEAKSLLSQTDISIKEIAFKLGFNDNAHFHNFFKKHTQITPDKYRKEQKL